VIRNRYRYFELQFYSTKPSVGNPNLVRQSLEVASDMLQLRLNQNYTTTYGSGSATLVSMTQGIRFIKDFFIFMQMLYCILQLIHWSLILSVSVVLTVIRTALCITSSMRVMMGTTIRQNQNTGLVNNSTICNKRAKEKFKMKENLTKIDESVFTDYKDLKIKYVCLLHLHFCPRSFLRKILFKPLFIFKF
jgi:hypothetical protein